MGAADVPELASSLSACDAVTADQRNPRGTRTLFYFCNVGWFFISHRLALARTAQEHGYDVHVVCDIEDEREVVQIEAAGLHFHRVRLSRGGLNPLSDLVTLLRTVALLLIHRPEVLHNVTIKPVLYGSIAARIARTRRVVNAISGLGYLFIDEKRSGFALRLVRYIYRFAMSGRAVRVIFQNEDDRKEFLSLGFVKPSQTVLIAGSGVDLARYRHVPEAESGPLRVVLPARMLADKGVHEFAEAARLLRSQGVSADFLLAGSLDPSNRAALTARQVAELEVRCGVKWLEHIEDMPALLEAAHIVCLPSYREGLPKALIEGCAVGRPIVTTDVPGCRAVVRHGVNGILVPVRSVNELAAALGQLLADRSMRCLMGLRARAIAEEEYDVRKVIEATMDLYKQPVAAG